MPELMYRMVVCPPLAALPVGGHLSSRPVTVFSSTAIAATNTSNARVIESTGREFDGATILEIRKSRKTPDSFPLALKIILFMCRVLTVGHIKILYTLKIGSGSTK